ncbi:hypothetical protein VTK73DRAFT_4253 [Phialemonium thermophilum]|uniref:Uncharacterized protein n=1 Tax=Phialemonium thermophilum TaxID=223376 RepID=A0ABR3VAI8_9PEZI
MAAGGQMRPASSGTGGVGGQISHVVVEPTSRARKNSGKKLLRPRGTNSPWPADPTIPPWSRSHTTSPRTSVYRGHCDTSWPSDDGGYQTTRSASDRPGISAPLRG